MHLGTQTLRDTQRDPQTPSSRKLGTALPAAGHGAHPPELQAGGARAQTRRGPETHRLTAARRRLTRVHAPRGQEHIHTGADAVHAWPEQTHACTQAHTEVLLKRTRTPCRHTHRLARPLGRARHPCCPPWALPLPPDLGHRGPWREGTSPAAVVWPWDRPAEKGLILCEGKHRPVWSAGLLAPLSLRPQDSAVCRAGGAVSQQRGRPELPRGPSAQKTHARPRVQGAVHVDGTRGERGVRRPDGRASWAAGAPPPPPAAGVPVPPCRLGLRILTHGH